MKVIENKKVVVIIIAGFFLVACSTSNERSSTKDHPEHHIQDHEKIETHQEDAEHQHHEHGENEPSDLDQPLSHLFAATCEHNLKAYECDECRYEVGVVKADQSLFAGGLLKQAKVKLRTIALPLKLTGEVRFDERRVVQVSTQAEGVIKKVYVTLGDMVKRGQPLIEIESVAVGEAQAAYLESRGMLALARRNYERQDALSKEGITSEKELLSARQEYETAQIRNDAALGRLTRLGMSVSKTRNLTQANSRGQLVLRAPSDGTVLDIHAVSGELAHTQTFLATIGDNSIVWVWADLYERDIAIITREQARQSLEAVIEVKAFPDQEFVGTVDFISPSMSESSRTVKIRITAPNPEKRLLAGMFAQVKVFIPGKQKVLTVPKKSVLLDDGRDFVFVHYQDDYYVRRPVVVGRSFASVTEIKKGLSGSELVVADGAFLMKSDVLRSKMGAGCAD